MFADGAAAAAASAASRPSSATSTPPSAIPRQSNDRARAAATAAAAAATAGEGGGAAYASGAVTLEQILMHNFHDNRVEGLRRSVSGEKGIQVRVTRAFCSAGGGVSTRGVCGGRRCSLHDLGHVSCGGFVLCTDPAQHLRIAG